MTVLHDRIPYAMQVNQHGVICTGLCFARYAYSAVISNIELLKASLRGLPVSMPTFIK